MPTAPRRRCCDLYGQEFQEVSGSRRFQVPEGFRFQEVSERFWFISLLRRISVERQLYIPFLLQSARQLR